MHSERAGQNKPKRAARFFPPFPPLVGASTPPSPTRCGRSRPRRTTDVAETARGQRRARDDLAPRGGAEPRRHPRVAVGGHTERDVAQEQDTGRARAQRAGEPAQQALHRWVRASAAGGRGVPGCGRVRGCARLGGGLFGRLRSRHSFGGVPSLRDNIAPTDPPAQIHAAPPRMLSRAHGGMSARVRAIP